jgi:predicted AAA+ superfamily ATPase
MWENFLLIERRKYLNNHLLYRNVYFWRTHAGAEIDYIEEYDGALHTYEFKWGNKIPRQPKAFIKGYDDVSFEVVNKGNFIDFVRE